ncbi:MAG: PLD nuclease N-terminal domain-containing protein [Candidatus Dormibacteria bacterium]
MTLSDLAPLLLPVVVVHLVLAFLALRDLRSAPPDVAGGSRAAWALVIALGALFGPVAYFAFGRAEE